jgi:hypothetical protein
MNQETHPWATFFIFQTPSAFSKETVLPNPHKGQ